MSLFKQTSFWDIPRGPDTSEELGKTSLRQDQQDRPEPMRDPVLPLTKLEDWSFRLENMANEAGDGRLLALESDILDLRDEVLFELHARI